MKYDYYLQIYGHPSLRRFPKGKYTGERWTGTFWTPQCANRDICQRTDDKLVTEAEAEHHFPGSVGRVEVLP